MNIEEFVLNYLKNNLEVFVGMKEPEKQEKYVLIEKTGSSEENFVNSVTFAIKSYANSQYEASMLNEAAKNAMKSIINSDEISKVKLNTDYNFTDTAKKKYRYQAVFDLVY